MPRIADDRVYDLHGATINLPAPPPGPIRDVFRFDDGDATFWLTPAGFVEQQPAADDWYSYDPGSRPRFEKPTASTTIW